MDIKKIVIDSVEERLGVKVLNGSMKLREDFEADELDLTEIIFELEDEFDFEMDNEEFERVTIGDIDITIDDLVALVEKYSQ